MRVLVVNDDVNSAPVVAHALMAVCGLSGEHAWAAAQRAHLVGQTDVAEVPDQQTAENVVLRLLRYGVHAAIAP